MEKYILVTRVDDHVGRRVVSALLGLGQRISVVDRRTEGIDPRAEVAAVGILNGDKGVC